MGNVFSTLVCWRLDLRVATRHNGQLCCAFHQGLNPYSISSFNYCAFEEIKELLIYPHPHLGRKGAGTVREGCVRCSSFPDTGDICPTASQRSRPPCQNAAGPSIKLQGPGSPKTPHHHQEKGRKHACSVHQGKLHSILLKTTSKNRKYLRTISVFLDQEQKKKTILIFRVGILTPIHRCRRVQITQKRTEVTDSQRSSKPNLAK